MKNLLLPPILALALSASATASTALQCDFSPYVGNYPFLGVEGITTTNPLANTFFRQGIYHMWSFNEVEAMKSFECCIDADPNSAMCYFGKAYASGPFLNKPTCSEEELISANKSVKTMSELAAKSSLRDIELLLVESFVARFPSSDINGDQTLASKEYRDILRNAVYPKDGEPTTFANDNDLLSMYAEAEMDYMASQGVDYYYEMKQLTHGEPRQESIDAIIALDTVFGSDSPDHPLAAHMMIHITEPLSPLFTNDDAPTNINDYARRGK